MDVSLGPELEQIVRERIRRGDYDSPNALIQEAVYRLIAEDEADADELRGILSARNAEVDRGDALDLDEGSTKELARDVHLRGLSKLKSARNRP